MVVWLISHSFSLKLITYPYIQLQTAIATTSQNFLPREGDIPLDGSNTVSERNPLIDDNKFNQPGDGVLQKPSLSDVQLDNNELEDAMEKITVSLKKKQ